MTGLEGAALGAAAKGVSVAGRALSGSKAEQAALLEEIRQTPGFRAAANAKGERLAMRELWINKLMAPLFKMVGRRADYFGENGEFVEDLANVLADVPDEELVSPAPIVAAQAIEGLAYSLDEPDLKQMYLNLLASASTAKRASIAHPAYASIIQQLSAEEAPHLARMFDDSQGRPLAEIRLDRGAGQFVTLVRHVADLRDAKTDEPIEVEGWAAFVENWVRLGLGTVSYDTYRIAQTAYDYVHHRPEYQQFERGYAQVGLPEGQELTFAKGLFIPTMFGIRFRGAAMPSRGDHTSVTMPID